MARTAKRTRSTAQHQVVFRALVDTPGFVSAQTLHRRLIEDGSTVGLATVYRRLNTLVETGEADTVSVASGQLFRACVPGNHHHHLICEECGKAIEITPPDEDWFVRIAQQHGFTVTRHVLEIFGRCADCSSP